MHSVDDLVVCIGDFDVRVCWHVDSVREGHGAGQRNLEAGMLVEFCLENYVC